VAGGFKRGRCGTRRKRRVNEECYEEKKGRESGKFRSTGTSAFARAMKRRGWRT